MSGSVTTPGRGPVIDRTARARWLSEGAATLDQRAAAEVDRIIADFTPSRLDDDKKQQLEEVMTAAAKAAGMDTLPEL